MTSSPPRRPTLNSSLAHIHHAADAVSSLHRLKPEIDILQRLAVSDELIHLQLASHVIIYQPRELRASLDSTERAALPHAARDELECYEPLAHVSPLAEYVKGETYVL